VAVSEGAAIPGATRAFEVTPGGLGQTARGSTKQEWGRPPRKSLPERCLHAGAWIWGLCARHRGPLEDMMGQFLLIARGLLATIVIALTLSVCVFGSLGALPGVLLITPLLVVGLDAPEAFADRGMRLAMFSIGLGLALVARWALVVLS